MSIPTQEIKKENWPAYFKDLSKQYYGWSVTIEAMLGELGDQPAANGPPLQGMSFETQGSAAGDMLIEVGDAGTPYEVHRINQPRTLRAADTQPGGEADIQIESEDGTATIVRLRRRPELPPAQTTQTARNSGSKASDRQPDR